MTDRVTTRFTAESTADDVLDGTDLTGRRAVVTGASSGIGLETARALAARGMSVTLAVRDTVAGERAREQIERTVERAKLSVARLDLTDRRSIDEFTRWWSGPLDLLINNAGVMATPETRTAEGWELQFVTNHLGHFGLALALRPHLADGAAMHGGARVVTLSSAGHHFAPVDIDDLTFERRTYDPLLAYGHSKSATIAFAVEAHRRWASDGITVNAVNPGGIATNLQRHLTPELADYFDRAEQSGGFRYKTVQQGAATTLVAAVAPEFDSVGGRYLNDCAEAEILYTGSGVEHPDTVSHNALDPDLARAVWAGSLELIESPLSPR